MHGQTFLGERIRVNAWVDKSSGSGQLSNLQMKGKIITLEKQLATKDSEITQLKAEVLSVQNTMEEKMKLMAKSHEDKVTELLKKTRELLNEIAQMRKEKKAVSLSRSGAEAAAGVSLHLHLRQVSRRPGGNTWL